MFYYECQETNRVIPISYHEIEDLARDMGDENDVDSMSDDVFLSYCELIARSL